MAANNIIIKKTYFDNTKTAIDAINSFFGSNFKTKNFPIVDVSFQLDSTITGIINWLNYVEPTWIDDSEKVEKVLTDLHDATQQMTGDIYEQLEGADNTLLLDHINAFIGFKVLQYLSDYFTEFNELINGIYTFELFTKPSKYKNTIDVFSKPIDLSEIEYIIGDREYTLFDSSKYITSVFSNDLITLPETLKLETEIQRFENGIDMAPNSYEIFIDENVQEAASVNHFKETKPEHIKYDVKTKKFVLSNQYKKKVETLLSGLKKCDTIDDLANFFLDAKTGDVIYPDFLTSNVSPFILNKVFDNPKKYPFDNFDVDSLSQYTKSYKSIIGKNNGAKRFYGYDVFSTFKIDKEGTINFLRDFLMLNLFNDKNTAIVNNVLLTVFNIFDSRIYFDILYNIIPDDVKKKDYPTEDGFVKDARAIINKNSKNVNTYQSDTSVSSGNETPTSDQVQEYVFESLNQLGDITISEMAYCEHFQSIIDDELSMLNDKMYNSGTSQIMIDRYIGESYNVFNEGFFSKIFDKQKIRKMLKQLESVESKYNIKFSEEYKSFHTGSETIANIVGADDVELVDHIFKFIWVDSKEWIENISKSPKIGLFPVGIIQTGLSITSIPKIDINDSVVYSDTTGVLYCNKLGTNDVGIERLAGSITEFIKNIFQITVKIPNQLKSFNMELSYTDMNNDLDYIHNCDCSTIGTNSSKDEMYIYPYVSITDYLDTVNASDIFGEYMRSIVLRSIKSILLKKDNENNGLYEKYFNNHPDDTISDVIKLTKVTFIGNPNDPKVYAIQYHIDLIFGDIHFIVSHINESKTSIAYYGPNPNNSENINESYNVFEESFVQEAESKKQKRRIEKFLKERNYDPNTEMIDTEIIGDDGKKKRVKFNITQANIINSDGGYSPKNDTIYLTRETMRRKPDFSKTVFDHESGHKESLDGSPFTKSELFDKAKEFIRMNGTTDMDSHALSEYEYVADALAMDKSKNKQLFIRSLNKLRSPKSPDKDRIDNEINLRQKFLKELISESFAILTDDELSSMVMEEFTMYVQELDMGDIPDYIKDRINISDGDSKPDVSVTDVDLPPDMPTNPVDDLIGSIDAKLSAGGDIDDMLGSGYNDNPNKQHDGKVVYNITINDSFNKDQSTHITKTDSSTGKTVNKSNSDNIKINSNTRIPANNYNNGNNLTSSATDTKEDNSKRLSNGHTIQELFAILESEEPLSNAIDKGDAGEPPKDDILTKAMDADRKTLGAQQKLKKGVQKAVNTGRAIVKPAVRTKQWLTKIIDSLIKRDEDRVKAEIIENPSYRTALYKAMRLAIKFGLTGIAFTISGYLGTAYLVIQGAKVADKQRLKKEVQDEFAVELEILNDKINRASNDDTPEARKAMWQMMRLRKKMENIVAISPSSRVKHPKSLF